MTDHDDDLRAAAAVHAAREALMHAVGSLACSPLDEQAANRMRAALELVDSPAVRAAIRRIRPAPRPPGARPFLTVVHSAEARPPSAWDDPGLTAPRGAA